MYKLSVLCKTHTKPTTTKYHTACSQNSVSDEIHTCFKQGVSTHRAHRLLNVISCCSLAPYVLQCRLKLSRVVGLCSSITVMPLCCMHRFEALIALVLSQLASANTLSEFVSSSQSAANRNPRSLHSVLLKNGENCRGYKNLCAIGPQQHCIRQCLKLQLAEAFWSYVTTMSMEFCDPSAGQPPTADQKLLPKWPSSSCSFPVSCAIFLPAS